MGTWLSLKRHFWHYRWRYLSGILCLLAGDAAELLVPQVLKTFVNTVTAKGATLAAITQFGLDIILLGLVFFAATFGWRFLVTGASRHIDYRLRSELFDQFSNLSVNYFNRHKTGDLMAHATNDLNAIRMALGMGVVTVFDATFTIFTTVVIMVTTISAGLSALALIPLPLVAITTFFLGRIIHKRFLVVQDAFAQVTDQTQETISGIRVVKSYVQEESEFTRFSDKVHRYVRSQLHMMRVSALFEPLVDFIAGVSFCIALGVGGVAVLNGTISLGNFVAFISYLGMLTWPMMSIGMLMNTLQRGGASLERINRIFAEMPEITDAADAAPLSRLRGDIAIEGLTFRYDGAIVNALENVHLNVKAGETIGIVGHTGSGKSTLLSLLLRLFDPPAGTVMIDGIDVRKLKLSTLRENIGYVPPDNFLFSETIAENIGFGVDRLDEEDMLDVASIAQVHESVQDFSQGYETVLGERGVTLSGGQKQRVAIARALAKRPPILVLDDCLSAVDTSTEEAILSRLKTVRRGQTTLIVAHRTSTVKHADQIVVLAGGRIAELGSHDDLLARGGIYAQMVRRQRLRDRITVESGIDEGVGA